MDDMYALPCASIEESGWEGSRKLWLYKAQEEHAEMRWDGNENMDDSQADRGRDHLDNSDVHALDEGKN